MNKLEVQNLPVEILETIFRQILKSQNGSTEIRSLRGVSISWKNIIENAPELRKELHLKLMGWDIKPNSLIFLEKSVTDFYQISLIQIDYQQIPESIWKNILKHTKVLTFRYCLKLRLKDFSKILSYCNDLEEIQISDHFPSFGPGYQFSSFKTLEWNVPNLIKFEMIRASAVDNEKLEYFFNKIDNLKHLRIESSYLNRMEDMIFGAIKNKINSIQSLYLIDNKECADSVRIMNELISMYKENFKLITFGCRLNPVMVTPIIKKLLEIFKQLRTFEVWTDEANLDPKFLFETFSFATNLKKIIIHCNYFDKTYTRREVQTYEKQKLKQITFFPD